jgi:hypothetical protein
MDLTAQLEAAQAEVARIEQRMKSASCAERGHPMKFIGCRACCCDLGDNLHGMCSLPVHACECGDCDYGENDESDAIRAECMTTPAPPSSPDSEQP